MQSRFSRCTCRLFVDVSFGLLLGSTCLPSPNPREVSRSSGIKPRSGKDLDGGRPLRGGGVVFHPDVDPLWRINSRMGSSVGFVGATSGGIRQGAGRHRPGTRTWTKEVAWLRAWGSSPPSRIQWCRRSPEGRTKRRATPVQPSLDADLRPLEGRVAMGTPRGPGSPPRPEGTPSAPASFGKSRGGGRGDGRRRKRASTDPAPPPLPPLVRAVLQCGSGWTVQHPFSLEPDPGSIPSLVRSNPDRVPLDGNP